MDHGKMHQDLLTKFCILRPIKNKYPTEVAAQHMDSFPLLGAPAILQSDNGTEFIAHVISEMKDFQPALVMVHSKPHHPQSQGSVERANGDIKDMLVAWLADDTRLGYWHQVCAVPEELCPSFSNKVLSMLSFVWWRFVWDSRRLPCHRKCSVNWTIDQPSTSINISSSALLFQ